MRARSRMEEHLVYKGRLLGAHLAVLPNAAIRVLPRQATPGPPVAAYGPLSAREGWSTGRFPIHVAEQSLSPCFAGTGGHRGAHFPNPDRGHVFGDEPAPHLVHTFD